MTHRPFSKMLLSEFEEEIRDTEAILAPYRNMKKWFRYPFLDYGNNRIFQSLDLLKQLGYVEGYVTINTFDWYIDRQLANALNEGNQVDYQKLRDCYLRLLKEWCTYYIDLYRARYAKEIIHTLLLHANDLNALYLEDILLMLKESGWNIVSPEIAFKNGSWCRENHHYLKKESLPASMNCKTIKGLMPFFN